MDPQQSFFSPGTGFSPFAGSPQGGPAAAGFSPAAGLNRHFSLSSPGGLGFPSPDQTSAATSPSMIQPGIQAADLFSKTGISNGAFSAGSSTPGGYRSASATLAAAGRQLSAGSGFQNQQLLYQQQAHPGLSSPWRANSTEDALAAAVAAAGLAPPPPPPPPYHSKTASPLNRAATATAQQLLFQQQQQQQQQAALARSMSIDVGVMSAQAVGGYLGGSGRWSSSRMPYDAGGLAAHEQSRFGSVYDMKSLTAALAHVQAGTGDVRRMLSACTFKPRLPGLTKLVSQMSREGHWAKALEVYESLDAVGVRPDTTITNAAISACDKGGQWEKALQVFKSMSDMGMERDAITYSALISALSKGRQWSLAIDVFNHMVAEGVECDAVTCCSLITALDKGGQWQLAEQVFIQMYRHHPQFHVLLEGMDTEPADLAGGSPTQRGGSSSPEIGRASSLLAGSFTTAALNALSISEDALPPPEQLLAMMEASGAGSDAHKSSSSRDQDKPPSPGEQPSGKSSTSLLATTLGKQIDYGSGGNTTIKGNTRATNTASSHNSNGIALSTTTAASKHSAGNLSTTTSTMHASSADSKQVEAGSVGGADTCSSGTEGTTSAGNQSNELTCADSSGPIRTLSGAWSKIMAQARAEAQASSVAASNCAAAAVAVTGSSNTTATGTGQGGLGTCSRGGSDDSLLTASDAVVHLRPVGNFNLIDAKTSTYSAAERQQQGDGADTAGASSLDPSTPADAAAPLFRPGTSAFAAAGSTPLEPDTATSSTPDQQHKGAAFPHRPPLHPTKHTGVASSLHTPPAASQGSLGDQGISPAGSLGLGPGGSTGSASPARSGSGGMMRLGLTRSLNSKKSSPNRVCCNALLAAYARATPPRWRQALKLLEVMWQCGGELVPDIVSYNTVMKACGNAQQTDKAFDLYQHMHQRSIEPTVATFGTLITIASEAQAYDRVKQSWSWLQASGLPVHITCINSYLTALIKEDNWNAAVELFQQVKGNQLGVKANSVTYNILMSACLTRDRPQNVQALFDEMTAANLSPTLISFNTLLHAYAKMGAWKESLGVLQHMCTSSPVRPSTASFNTVFCTLTNVAQGVGDADKQVVAARALEAYSMMTQLPGLHPDSALYRTIIGTFSVCAAPNMVLQVALIMAQQGHSMDAASASASLEALQQESAWHLSGPLLYACLDAGALVSPLLLQHILLVCTRDKAWRVAKEVLQVTCAAKQLDAVAQLLQQTRTQLQAASSAGTSPGQALMQAGAPGLLGEPEALDELLFLTYLQAQYSSGGWAEGVGLFRQLQQNRGATFAVCNGVLLGSLLELLVVRGGAPGTIDAMSIVDNCHAKGVMSHYILAAAAPTSSSATASSPLMSPASSKALPAAASSLLSPEQQLILRLESGGMSLGQDTGSAAGPAGGSSSMGAFSLFPGMSPGQGRTSLDLSGGVVFGQGGGGLGSGPGPLSLLDVRGCSAVEALVLTLSWLGQLVVLFTSGQAFPAGRLRVETGSMGPLMPLQIMDMKLFRPVGSAGAAGEGSSQAGGGEAGSSSTGGVGTVGPAGAEAPAGSEEDATAALAAAPATGFAAAAAMDRSTSLMPPVTGAAGASDRAAASQSDALLVPGSNLSVHTVVLSLFSGELSTMLGCADAMELLVAFSAGGRLPLALLCLAPLPVHLPDELAGGGVELDGYALREAIASAVAAASGQGLDSA